MPITGDNIGRQTVSTKKADEIRKAAATVVKKTTSKPKTTTTTRRTSSTTSAQRQKIAATQEFTVPKPEPIPDPVITSGRQLRIQAVKDLSGHVEQYKEIDPKATYVYESGEQISGSKLKLQTGKDIRDSLLGTTKIKPGMYVESEGQQYRVTGETRYLVEHAEPKEVKKLVESFGKTGYEGLPSGFIGPVKPPSYEATQKAYGSLTKHEKETYGFTYTPFIHQPIDEWKYHPGGKKYLGSLSPEEKDRLLTDYLLSDTWSEYIGSAKGVKERQAAAMSMHELQVREPAVLIPGWLNPLGGDVKQPQWMADLNVSSLAVYDYKAAEKSIAKTRIFSDSDVYSGLGFRTRMGYSAAESMLTASLFPVTLAQTGVKYATGKGGYADPLGRIKSGKTFLPDVGKILAEDKVTPTRGVLTGGIETALTQGRSDYLDTVKKYPWESGAASMGEFMGLLLGGKAVHVGKVGAIKGLGYARSGIMKYTGLNIPGYTKIMYHMPHRMLRRSWVKLGTKNIDDVMGTPYHSTETLTKGGLSFAKGSTPSARITWTIGKTKASQSFKYSADDFLLGSSSTSRVGGRFVIKSQTLHELPAFSSAPYGFTPTRFYRFTPSGLSYSSSFSLFPRFRVPTAFAVRIKNIFRPPKGSYSDVSKWASGQPKGSWGVVGPKMYLGGAETELNIFGKTVLKRFLPSSKKLFHRLKGYQFHTTVPLEGGLKEVVPVVFTAPIHKGLPTGVKSLLSSGRVGNGIRNMFASSSVSGASVPLLSPSYFAASALSYSTIGKSYGFSISTPKINVFPSDIYTPKSFSYTYRPVTPSISRKYDSSTKKDIISSNIVSSPFSKYSIPSIIISPSYPSVPSVFSSPSRPSRGYSTTSSSYSSTPSYPSVPSSSIPSFSSRSYSSIPSSIISSTYTPVIPIFYSKSYKSKKKKQVDPFKKYYSGYRERTWEVPTMEDVFNFPEIKRIKKLKF